MFDTIYCFDKYDNLVEIFYGLSDTIDWLKERVPFPNSKHVLDCIEGKRKTAYGFKFKTIE